MFGEVRSEALAGGAGNAGVEMPTPLISSRPKRSISASRSSGSCSPCAAGRVGDQVGRDQPDDLELEAVRVLGVQALGRAVIAGADECLSFGEHTGESFEIAQGLDLPGEVVQPDGATPCLRRQRRTADLEDAEVVIVGRRRGLEEGCSRELGDDPEPRASV